MTSADSVVALGRGNEKEVKAVADVCTAVRALSGGTHSVCVCVRVRVRVCVCDAVKTPPLSHLEKHDSQTCVCVFP